MSSATAYGGGALYGDAHPGPRLAVVPEGAAVGLAGALETVPSSPDVGAVAEWVAGYETGEVAIELVGYSLDEVSVTVRRSEHMNVNVFESMEQRAQGHTGWWGARSGRFGAKEKGDRFSVFLSPEDIAETVELTVSGRDLLGYRRIPLSLPGRPPEAVPVQYESSDED